MSLPFIWEGLKLLVWSMVSSVSLLLFAMCSNEGSLVHWYLFKPLCIFMCLNRWHELLITRGSFQHFWPRAFSFVIVFEWGEPLAMRPTVWHCVSSMSWSSSSSSTGYFNIYLSFFLLKGFNRYSLDRQDFQNCPVFLLKSKRLPSLQLCLFFKSEAYSGEYTISSIYVRSSECVLETLLLTYLLVLSWQVVVVLCAICYYVYSSQLHFIFFSSGIRASFLVLHCPWQGFMALGVVFS